MGYLVKWTLSSREMAYSWNSGCSENVPGLNEIYGQLVLSNYRSQNYKSCALIQLFSLNLIIMRQDLGMLVSVCHLNQTRSERRKDKIGRLSVNN